MSWAPRIEGPKANYIYGVATGAAVVAGVYNKKIIAGRGPLNRPQRVGVWLAPVLFWPAAMYAAIATVDALANDWSYRRHGVSTVWLAPGQSATVDIKGPPKEGNAS